MSTYTKKFSKVLKFNVVSFLSKRYSLCRIIVDLGFFELKAFWKIKRLRHGI